MRTHRFLKGLLQLIELRVRQNGCALVVSLIVIYFIHSLFVHRRQGKKVKRMTRKNIFRRSKPITDTKIAVLSAPRKNKEKHGTIGWHLHSVHKERLIAVHIHKRRSLEEREAEAGAGGSRQRSKPLPYFPANGGLEYKYIPPKIDLHEVYQTDRLRDYSFQRNSKTE